MDIKPKLDAGAGNIDFKAVIDALDDSVFITDKDGICIYVNPAYERNTTIKPEEVLGRSVRDIVAEGALFTGGATLDVLDKKERVFRLSTVNKMNPPQVGFAIGVPIFDADGALDKVVVSSRPILSLKSLREDYAKFVKLVKEDDRDKRIAAVKHENASSFSERLIGASVGLRNIWSIIQTAAPTDATVLISGESGVGKEVVADEIFRLSNRNGKPFIKVNCASIPANLLESELFGYEKGAFSGASVNGKRGLFELANGGTLLLDEIGDMSMDLQVKLLRAIQDKTVTRVGGTYPIKLDIRIIAATNCNLRERIEQGLFRQDLFYRLNVIPIVVPPLRERKDDLIELCRYFETVFSKKHKRTFRLTDAQMDIITSYEWPGNIRELENVIEYLTICSSGTEKVVDDMLRGILNIHTETDDVSSTSISYISQPVEETITSLSDSMQDYEKRILEKVLRETSSLREAGAKLGVNASTLSRKIKQYNINYSK